MTFQPGANLNTVAFGNRPENVEVPHIDTRDPTSQDTRYPLGKVWVNTVGESSFILCNLTTVSGITTAVWSTTGGASDAVGSLTGDTGTADPLAANIKISGTANQITTAASGSTVTLTLPSSLSAPGSITATSGNITATNGNLVMGTAGNKVIVPTGANASAGTSGAMSGTPGAVTVATTACSSTCLIFYSRNVTGGTPGEVSITAQSGTGFTLTSTGNETSTFNWWIINA